MTKNPASNYIIQSLGEPPLVPQPGTPVRYQGEVVGRVVGTSQDKISIEIDGEHWGILTKHFSDIASGFKKEDDHATD